MKVYNFSLYIFFPLHFFYFKNTPLVCYNFTFLMQEYVILKYRDYEIYFTQKEINVLSNTLYNREMFEFLVSEQKNYSAEDLKYLEPVDKYPDMWRLLGYWNDSYKNGELINNDYYTKNPIETLEPTHFPRIEKIEMLFKDFCRFTSKVQVCLSSCQEYSSVLYIGNNIKKHKIYDDSKTYLQNFFSIINDILEEIKIYAKVRVKFYLLADAMLHKDSPLHQSLKKTHMIEPQLTKLVWSYL